VGKLDLFVVLPPRTPPVSPLVEERSVRGNQQFQSDAPNPMRQRSREKAMTAAAWRRRPPLPTKNLVQCARYDKLAIHALD
jgi:hypothetical protein